AGDRGLLTLLAVQRREILSYRYMIDLVDVDFGPLAGFINRTEEIVELLQIAEVVTDRVSGDIPLVLEVFGEPVYVVLHGYSFGLAASGPQNGDYINSTSLWLPVKYGVERGSSRRVTMPARRADTMVKLPPTMLK